MPDSMKFTSVDPINGMTKKNPGIVCNLVNGEWTSTDITRNDIIDPINGEHFLLVPDTTDHSNFVKDIKLQKSFGTHNPLYKPERYLMLGEVCARAAALMAKPEIEHYFTKLIQRVMPKEYDQCRGEVTVTRVFLENFSGDGVRFLGRGFSNPGDHQGQESRGYRWPFGPVVVIAPFNFPLEIPALQALGALFMGNKPLVKVDSKVSVVFEQFVRLLIHCGLPSKDLNLIHCRGSEMGKLIEDAKESIRLIQFTGSNKVAEKLSNTMNGLVRLEDAGFDWKIIGPDFDPLWLNFVAWQSDQDAYNASGQKCSAQSILICHKNWSSALLPKLKVLASQRNTTDLSIGPVLSWSNEDMLDHIKAILDLPGTILLFGGRVLNNHQVPECYGMLEPTAIKVPLSLILGDDFELITTELFGPFQIIVEYDDNDLSKITSILERITNRLTAAIVSNEISFQQKILSMTVNGTTYCGMRARTTGAPQNHWFGPSGDPRAAGIGTPEAIRNTWSGHREIIFDQGPLATNWQPPKSSEHSSEK
jgi:1-pyrroline-5-carboxylate dehydrogenase